ncbi:MAG TPA: serine hydrolase domain-containing protein [Chloroflexota bacterium]|nr:serine hydrolase domain-containing protein [Chloroflexota bacterium]
MRRIELDRAREAGFDPDRLRRAFGLLEGWTEDGTVPGAGALIARDGKIAGEAYVGLAHRAEKRAVSADTVWSLASITKPFTATALLQVVEDGLVALDEPVYRLFPEFLDAPETAFNRRAVTVRHLLTHSSGLPGFSPDNLALRQAHRPLEDFVRSFASQALAFAPGSAHLYSNPAILSAAEIAARASTGSLGKRQETPRVGKIHTLIAERILGPLGMQNSTMKPPADWADRIAWVEATGQEGTDYEMANSAYYRSLGIPWGGLFSTPRDLARFVDLFLPSAGGAGRLGFSDGARPRVVSPATARAMTSVQVAPPEVAADVVPDLRDAGAPDIPQPAVEWGLGWEVKGGKRGHRSGDLTSPATYSHAGATGTMVWADPLSGIVCVLLTNQTLVSGWTSRRARQAAFSNAVAAAATS